MRASAQILTRINSIEINSTPNEHEPLISAPVNSRSVQSISRPPPILLPQKSFLLTDIEKAIGILDKIKEKTLCEKLIMHRQAYHWVLFTYGLLMVMSGGLTFGMLAVMWVMMEKLYDKTFHQLQNKIFTDKNEIHQDQINLNELRNNQSYWSELYNDAIDDWENADMLWDQCFDERGDTCEIWKNSQNKTVAIWNIFRNYDRNDLCCFNDWGFTHPIPYCDQLASHWCGNITFSSYADDMQQQFWQEIVNQQGSLSDLMRKLNHTESALTHLHDKPEPYSMSSFATTSAATIALVIFLLYRGYQKKNNYYEQIKNERKLLKCLPAHEINFFINLALRLKVTTNDLESIDVDQFYNYLKNTAKDIRERITIISSIFSKKNKNIQKFMQEDSRGEMKKIICDQAGLVQKSEP